MRLRSVCVPLGVRGWVDLFDLSASYVILLTVLTNTSPHTPEVKGPVFLRNLLPDSRAG